jgi:alpha-tubulin suppressor-like RCC1 family protein
MAAASLAVPLTVLSVLPAQAAPSGWTLAKTRAHIGTDMTSRQASLVENVSGAWSWGLNNEGHLGNGSAIDKSSVPVPADGLSDVTAVATGVFHSLALRSDGSVWGWGDEYSNGVAADTNVPMRIAGLTATSIVAGQQISGAVGSDGSAWAWGGNTRGLLGRGDISEQPQNHVPGRVIGLTDVVSIDAEFGHFLALRRDGSVWAWGDNRSGQLGTPGLGEYSAVPVKVEGLSNIRAIATTAAASFAADNTGEVWAWGTGELLGDGVGQGRPDSNTPIKVSGLSGVTALSGASATLLALRSDGSLVGWGSNAEGQLGTGSVSVAASPVAVGSGLAGVSAVAAGTYHTIALDRTGRIFAWGENRYGQLGDGSTESSLTPVEVSSISGATAIAANQVSSIAAISGTGNPSVPAFCKDAALLGARGSGDNGHGTDYPGRHAIEMAKVLRETYGLQLYDNDSNPGDGAFGVAYPAVSVLNFELPAYRTSVNNGVANILFSIRSLRSACGDQYPILLTGFSQGAHVIQTVLDRLDGAAGQGDDAWRSVSGVALLASPRFGPRDPLARGSFAERANVGPGIARSGTIPVRFEGVARTFCAAGDYVCSALPLNLPSLPLGGHTAAYGPDAPGSAMAKDAAGLMAWGAKQRSGVTVRPAPTGSATAVRLNITNTVRVSAAAIYSNGAPAVNYAWDFTNDGTLDRSGPAPWVTHNYGLRQGSAGRVTTRVVVRFADGSEVTRQICVRKASFGSTTC